MTHPNIVEEIGLEYEGDLMCIGVMEQPAIILKNTKTGQKTMMAIGSPAYMELEPKRKAVPVEPKEEDASPTFQHVGPLPSTCMLVMAGAMVYMVVALSGGAP